MYTILSVFLFRRHTKRLPCGPDIRKKFPFYSVKIRSSKVFLFLTDFASPAHHLKPSTQYAAHSGYSIRIWHNEYCLEAKK